MNTLPRSITASLFTDEAAYHALMRHWRDVVNAKPRVRLSAEHYLLYLALLGRDWRCAFTPISNARTLQNGGFNNWGLVRALRVLHSRWCEDDLLAPFAPVVSPEMLQCIRDLLPAVSDLSSDATAYHDGRFPIGAYRDRPSGAEASTGPEATHA